MGPGWWGAARLLTRLCDKEKVRNERWEMRSSRLVEGDSAPEYAQADGSCCWPRSKWALRQHSQSLTRITLNSFGPGPTGCQAEGGCVTQSTTISVNTFRPHESQRDPYLHCSDYWRGSLLASRLFVQKVLLITRTKPISFEGFQLTLFAANVTNPKGNWC